MTCNKASEMTFEVFDLDNASREYPTGKTFIASTQDQEMRALLIKLGFSPDRIDNYFVVIAMLYKLFNFTTVPNGFYVAWDPYADFKVGTVS
jgi:hypothetical protein